MNKPAKVATIKITWDVYWPNMHTRRRLLRRITHKPMPVLLTLWELATQ